MLKIVSQYTWLRNMPCIFTDLLNICGQSEDILPTYDQEPISKFSKIKNNTWINQHAKFEVQFILLSLNSVCSNKQEIFKIFKNILQIGAFSWP